MSAVLATPLLPVLIKPIGKGQPGAHSIGQGDGGADTIIELFAREDTSGKEQSDAVKVEQLTHSSVQIALVFRDVGHGDPVLRLALEDPSFHCVVGVVPVDPSLLPFLPSSEELSGVSDGVDLYTEKNPRLAGIAALRKAFHSRKMRPVFVDGTTTWHNATAGFAQAVLWPIFHSRPFSSDYVIAAHLAGTSATSSSMLASFGVAGVAGGGVDALSGPFSRGPDSGAAEPRTPSSIKTLEETFLDAYRALNNQVAQALALYAPEDAAIIIHGHQQLLLPTHLRPLLKKGQTIALFNHLPFPTSELYRILPARYELLMKGMLGSDVVGFNSADYGRHFLSSCVRIGGLEVTAKGVHAEGRFVHAHTCPVGIDPRRIEALLAKPDVRRRIEELRLQFAGKKVILGVDELDVTKGVTQKLMAFEELLKTKPELRGNTVMVQVSTPPPPQAHVIAESTEKLQWQLLDLVGRICGTYGQLTSPAGATTTAAGGSRFQRLSGGPVYYFQTPADEEELVCLYAVADLYLDTSLRDCECTLT
jgi:trehalose-6-phosphate synthase